MATVNINDLTLKYLNQYNNLKTCADAWPWAAATDKECLYYLR